jgi:hypothetical protein
MEDFKKNFVLLSQVAKEKKYAQEYLGLLARRGDIGSIRIGKRWYTTWPWFEEFLENSQKKKAEAVEMAVAPVVLEMAKKEEIKITEIKEMKMEAEMIPILLPSKVEEKIPEEKIKISLPVAIPMPVAKGIIPEAAPVAIPDVSVAQEIVREIPKAIFSSEAFQEPESAEKIAVKVALDDPAPKIYGAEAPVTEWKPVKVNNLTKPTGETSPIRVNQINIQKIPIRQKSQNVFPARKMNQIVRKNIPPVEMRKERRESIPGFSPALHPEKRVEVYREIRVNRSEDGFSPDFSEEEKLSSPIFSRFAFALSFAIIIVLVAASGYFIFSGGLFKNGVVAGASDERNGDFPSITSQGEGFLTHAGDKIKESVSLSRMVVQMVKEKSENGSPSGETAK